MPPANLLCATQTRWPGNREDKMSVNVLVLSVSLPCRLSNPLPEQIVSFSALCQESLPNPFRWQSSPAAKIADKCLHIQLLVHLGHCLCGVGRLVFQPPTEQRQQRASHVLRNHFGGHRQSRGGEKPLDASLNGRCEVASQLPGDSYTLIESQPRSRIGASR
jgi:hypothetical protein